MQLSIVFAVVATVILSASAVAQPVANATWRLGVSAGAAMLVVLFAVFGSWTVSRRLSRDFGRRQKWLRYFEVFRRIHLAFWLSISGGILYCLQWPRLVRCNWGLQGTVLLDELLIFVPVLLPLIASWAAFHEVDRTLLRTQATLAGASPSVMRRGRYLWLHVRHHLGLVLLPVLGVVAMLDFATWWMPAWIESSFAWPLYFAPLAVVTVALPLLLRFLWRTEPLPAGPLRERLEMAAQQVGLRVRDILVWKTNGRVVNAAVIGLMPSLRYVLLSDGLLARLSDEEVEAVFLHEAGHVRRRHLLLRVFVLCLPLCLWLGWQAIDPAVWESAMASLEMHGLGRPFAENLLVPFGVTLYAVLALGWCSRWLEHDADLWACRFLTKRNGQKAPADVAVECYISAFEKLTLAGGAGPRQGSWLHPSFASRAEMLRKTRNRPELA